MSTPDAEPRYQSLIGWNYQPTKGTAVTNEYFIYGFNETSWGKFPQLQSNILSQYRGPTYDPYYMSSKMTSVTGEVNYAFINGLPFTHLYSKNNSVVDQGSNTFFIDPGLVDGSQVDLYTNYFKRASSGYSTKKNCVDSMYRMFGCSINIEEGLPLAGQSIFTATQMASVTPTNDTPVDPRTDDVLDVDTVKNYLYYWDKTTNSRFYWGGTITNGQYASGGTDYKNYLLSFSFNGSSMNSWKRQLGQYYPAYQRTSDRINAASFRFLATDDTTIYDAYLAQAANADTLYSSPQTMTFKISNAAGGYIQIDMNDVWIDKCVENVPDEALKEKSYYDFTAQFANATFTIKESWADTNNVYRVV